MSNPETSTEKRPLCYHVFAMQIKADFDQAWAVAQKESSAQNFEVVEHGWEQHVLVDHEKNLVYRYPRNQNSANKLADEVGVLRALHDTTFNVAIPRLRDLTGGYAVYDYIPGDVLSEDGSLGLSDNQAREIGYDLGIFFGILHACSPSIVNSKKTKQTTSLFEYYAERIESAKDRDFYEKARGLLLSLQPEAEKQAVVHGDLHGLNMVLDPISKKLTGIIDFSELELGDPHQDLRKPFMTDGRFLEPMITAYKNATGISLDPEKVRIWAYVNEWANIAYFNDQPSNPTYIRAQKHLRRWNQL